MTAMGTKTCGLGSDWQGKTGRRRVNEGMGMGGL